MHTAGGWSVLAILSLSVVGCARGVHGESEDTLRLKVLAETPVGAPLGDVRQTAARYDAGCLGGGLSEYGMNQGSEVAATGRKLARRVVTVCAGSGFEFPFRVFTFVKWYVDEEGRLLDVVVQREADGL